MAENFTPGETISLNAQSSSQSAAFNLAQSAAYPDCMVTNAGAVTVFVGFNGQATLGGANGTPVLPGESLILHKGASNVVSAVTQTGNALVYFTAGQGN